MLLARIYGAFPLVCPICHAEMRIIAFINEACIVKKILDHIGESTQAPRIAPARGPPLWEAAEPAGNDPQWERPPSQIRKSSSISASPGSRQVQNHDKLPLAMGRLAPVARKVATSGSCSGDRR